jgi:hypothetical protein
MGGREDRAIQPSDIFKRNVDMDLNYYYLINNFANLMHAAVKSRSLLVFLRLVLLLLHPFPLMVLA